MHQKEHEAHHGAHNLVETEKSLRESSLCLAKMTKPAGTSLVSSAAVLGLIVSGYALYVEYEHHQAAKTGIEYVAMCDFGLHMSCSDVLTSEYGTILSKWGLVPKGSMLDLPNAALGSVYYLIALSYPMFSHVVMGRVFMLGASTFSLLFSLYLAYVLRFILHDLCVVCVTSYVINTFIFANVARGYMAGVPKGTASKAVSSTKMD